jgi:hypothetical protein
VEAGIELPQATTKTSTKPSRPYIYTFADTQAGH